MSVVNGEKITGYNMKTKEKDRPLEVQEILKYTKNRRWI